MTASSPQKPLIELKNLRFSWQKNTCPIIQLDSLSFKPGEHVFIRGASGSGKSTLLNLIGGVLTPQSGSVAILGKDICGLSSSERDRFRADHIGVIFQQFNLIPYLSILENVILPCRFSPLRTARSIQRSGSVVAEATYLLSHLYDSNGPDLNQRVTDLSVGQQQRVAAARALMGRPELIIADEPTSSLDYDSRLAFMNLLFDEVDGNHSTLLFVSHDPTHQAMFSRSLDIEAINHAVPEQS
jgi:putative ABC transport system ATP-binding protein